MQSGVLCDRNATEIISTEWLKFSTWIFIVLFRILQFDDEAIYNAKFERISFRAYSGSK